MARRTLFTQLAEEACSSWIEINLDALEHNLEQVQKHSQVPILPILKGDAYGHGAPVIAAFLKSKKIPLLAVSSLEEALSILELTLVPLLILTPPLEAQLPLILKHKLIPTITSLSLLSTLVNLTRNKTQKITVHIKVDTGFGRLGVSPEKLLDLARQIKKYPNINLGGVFTHFPAAFNDFDFTQKQLHKFLGYKAKFSALGGFDHVLWHAANSSAFLTLPASHLDLVRIGTLIYGQSPFKQKYTWNLAPTWQFKTRIIQIKTLPAGHSVGYNRIYRTKKPTRIGIIPVGYSHGLELEPLTTPWRQLKHTLSSSIMGHSPISHLASQLPILGRVGMGLTTIDLSKVPHAKVGDCVTVSMRRVTANKHIPYIYLLNKKIKYIFWNQKLFTKDGVKIHSRKLF